MRNFQPCYCMDFDTYGYDNDQYIPERSLIAAILGRALQDLSDRKERKQALHWFLAPADQDAGGISYEMCLSILQLREIHIYFIKQRILDTLSGRNELTKLQRLRRVIR